MAADTPVDETDDINASPGNGPGEIMRQARIRMGLDSKQVAERLRLTEVVIEGIETDTYDALPEPAYIKGYIRAYARLLDLDHEPLLARYNALGLPEPEVSFGEYRTQEKAHNFTMRWGSVLVIVTLIGLVVVWWVSQNKVMEDAASISQAEMQNNATTDLQFSSPGFEASADKPAVSGLVELEPLPIGNIDNGLPVQVPSELGNQQALAVSPGDNLAPGVTPSSDELGASSMSQSTDSVSTEVALLKPGEGRLVLTYLDESWTEIIDAGGEVLLKGLVPAGEVQTLTGKPPFRFMLGNAPVVEIKLNDKRFDHSGFIRRNRTARFQVGLAQ